MKLELDDFPSDYRKSNPGLHMFYVKSAAVHLAFIDKTLKKLYGFSNTNTSEFASALQMVRAKKIKEDTAYADAHEILESAKAGKFIEPQNASEVTEPAA